MNNPFIFYQICYENGFKEFVECVERSSAKDRLSFDTLLSILYEQADKIYEEKGIKGLPKEEELRYYVTISLLIMWYPALLNYEQLKSFFFWGNKDIRRYMSKHSSEFKGVLVPENEEKEEYFLLDSESETFINLINA